jgi:formiminotetrahydrofolate cyclodeaminase
MSIEALSVDEFLERLASKAATPGGGSAAAVMGAMGAALVAMVCNLTIGKEKYAAVEPEMAAILGEADRLRGALTEAIAADVAVFGRVMAAYGMPRANDHDRLVRAKAVQSALKEATDVPLHCAQLCREVIELCHRAATSGNVNVISDAGVGVMAAYAAVKSAALNVFINIGALEDPDFVAARRRDIERIVAHAEQRVPEVYAMVCAKL